MTAVLVKVILDRYDGSQQLYTRGGGSFTPSLEFPDPADQMLIGQAPVPFSFRAGSVPFVELIANDTAGPQQENGTPGWTWNVTYDASTPGAPAEASYYVLSTSGTTQYLSSLAATPAAQPGGTALVVQGTPVPGAVPVVQANGSVAWSTAVILDTTGA